MIKIKTFFGGRPPPPPAPWRDMPVDKKSYLEEINNFKLNKDEVEHIRIMLYGPVGAGKSSLVNSVETVLRGRLTCQALTDFIGESSFTKKYETHTIKKGSGKYPFVFTDLMGLEKERKKGLSLEDVELALKGHVKDGYEFNPQTALSSDSPFYNSNPTINDKTHILVCVLPANNVNLLTDEHITKIRDVRTAARDLGIPQIAVLTKIDDACPEVQSNIKDVFRSTIIKKRTEEVYAAVGIQPNCIFPVKNYHSEFSLNDDMDSLILVALKYMINFGNDFVDKNV